MKLKYLKVVNIKIQNLLVLIPIINKIDRIGRRGFLKYEIYFLIFEIYILFEDK